MCGRYALGIPHHEIQALDGYAVDVGEWVGQAHFVPRFNVAPRSNAPVLRRADGARAPPEERGADDNQDASGNRAAAASAEAPNEEARVEEVGSATDGAQADACVLHTMKWGLVPHWSKHEDLTLNTINARAEALQDGSGMWKSLRGTRRCAVPVQGYYEWLKKGRERLPHYTRRADGKLMLLAGLWDVAYLEGQPDPLYTFTIVTTDACTDMAWLHDRQPVILRTDAALRAWLGPGAWDASLAALLAPYEGEPLTCYPVPKEVGKVGEESPTFVQPVAGRRDGIEAMFARQTAKATPSPSSSQKIKVEAKSPSPKKSPGKSPGKDTAKRKRSASPAHQPEAGSSSPAISPKRPKTEVKVDDSVSKEVIDLCRDDAADANGAVKGKTKAEPKLEKMNTWEDDEIEIVDAPATSSKSPEKSGTSAKKKLKPQEPAKSPPTKKPAKSKKADKSKITAYFGKS